SKIRSNVITFITPVLEVDGHEKMVDTYYYNKDLKAKYGKNAPQLPLMYWGKYVQHDDNRDGMGQYLKLTQNIMKTYLEWTPTVLHDLHEAIPYLYASTGTGPYNEALDPIVTDEWWILAKNDVSELTKRGVPGVWTYGFYDGWVPNYLFFIANAHNAIGRFYEVEGYGPDAYVGRTPRSMTSKEWFRPNPPMDSINWGPRANTNIQESALLFALHRVAEDHDMFMQNYWLKNKRSVDKGRNGPVSGWVIPAGQHARANTADAVNDLRRQGVEFNTASAEFKLGNIDVKPGDYIIRADQPYRTLVDMYFSLQNYPPDNPEPYDDTGWTFPLMRNLTVYPIESHTLLDQHMTPVTADVHATGGINGSGPVVIVDNTTDNTLITLRFTLARTSIQAAEEAFDADGHHFRAGAFVIQNADGVQLEPLLAQLGLSGYATANAPSVKMHELDVPRVALVHSWYITQEEGWVRAALDYFHVPYAYVAEPLLKPGNLRSKYDVIIYPNGGSGMTVPRGDTGFKDVAIPYERSAKYPNLGTPDSTSNVRESMGPEGMKALYEFVQQGGTLITEGGTAAFFPNLNLTPGVKVETPRGLFARGAIYRGMISDSTSPLVYGYQYNQIPVYFNSDPVLNAGAGATAVAAADLPPASGRLSFGPAEGATSVRTQDITPMEKPLRLSPWDLANTGRAYGAATIAADDSLAAAADKAAAATEARARNRKPTAQTLPGVTADPKARARVVLQFPAKPSDMLLSGTLEGGAALSNRAQLVDETIGAGHLVMFAIRPFWRWQTQGTFALGFNAILNWNHLGTGE
ncbi:MAG: M14 family zinc carboxypeptidase, partial [Gemmatimonadaceae bacterium]